MINKAVIFDVDGTLVDSNDLHVEAAAKAGMRSVGLLSGGFTEEALHEAGAVAVYRDVSDLLDHHRDQRRDARAGRGHRLDEAEV